MPFEYNDNPRFQYEGDNKEQKDEGFFGALGRGFERHLPEAKGMAYGAAGYLGDVANKVTSGNIGSGLRDWGFSNAQEKYKEAEQLSSKNDSFYSGNSLPVAFGNTLGSAAGSAVESAAAGLAGGLVGFGTGGIIGGGGGVLTGAIAKSVVKDSIKSAVKKGIATGIAADAVTQGVGSTYMDARENLGDNLTSKQLQDVGIYGVASGAVETAADLIGASGVAKALKQGYKDGVYSAVKEGAIATGKAVPREAITEGIQTQLQGLGAGEDKTASKEGWMDIAESMTQGAVGGAGLGGAHAVAGVLGKALSRSNIEQAAPQEQVGGGQEDFNAVVNRLQDGGEVSQQAASLPTDSPISINDKGDILQNDTPPANTIKVTKNQNNTYTVSNDDSITLKVGTPEEADSVKRLIETSDYPELSATRYEYDKATQEGSGYSKNAVDSITKRLKILEDGYEAPPKEEQNKPIKNENSIFTGFTYEDGSKAIIPEFVSHETDKAVMIMPFSRILTDKTNDIQQGKIPREEVQALTEEASRGVWLPKSQVTIQDGHVVGVSAFGAKIIEDAQNGITQEPTQVLPKQIVSQPHIVDKIIEDEINQYNQTGQVSPLINEIKKANLGYIDTETAVRSVVDSVVTGNTDGLPPKLVDSVKNMVGIQPLQQAEKITNIKSAITQSLGDRASKINIVSSEEAQNNLSGMEKLNNESRLGNNVEGFFNPRTGEINIIADNIKPIGNMTAEQRGVFVAWHEMFHRGMATGVMNGRYKNIIEQANTNAMVRKLAGAIQNDRGNISESLAIEESLAELRAAMETGNWQHLNNRYGMTFNNMQKGIAKTGVDKFLAAVRKFIADVLGIKISLTDSEVMALVRDVAEQDMGDIKSYGGDLRKSEPRTNVRGGWTKEKIIRRMKDSISKPLSGGISVSKLISQFSSAKEFAEHLYYHGTTSYLSSGLKPSATMSQRDVESRGGGGYGQKYFAISLTKSKRVAEAFSGSERSVSIYPVILNKNAKVITNEKYNDAKDIEDDIAQLWADGVDAVMIGGGEQELAVINPSAITLIKKPEHHQVFGGFKSKPLTDDEIKQTYENAKSNLEKIPTGFDSLPVEEKNNISRSMFAELKFSTRDNGYSKELKIADKLYFAAVNSGLAVSYDFKATNGSYYLTIYRKDDEKKDNALNIRISNHKNVYGGNDVYIDPSSGSLQDAIETIKDKFPEFSIRGSNKIKLMNLRKNLQETLDRVADIGEEYRYQSDVVGKIYDTAKTESELLLLSEDINNLRFSPEGFKSVLEKYGNVIKKENPIAEDNNAKERPEVGLTQSNNSPDFSNPLIQRDKDTSDRGMGNDNGNLILSQAPFDGKEQAKTKLGEGVKEINVDGVKRHALNSNGNPIHWSEEGIRNFWRWFGDSKVVDDEGRPLVVYHGTTEDFDTFDITKVGNGVGGKEKAMFFTPNVDNAGKFATYGYKPNPSVMPVYLNLKYIRVYKPNSATYHDFSVRQRIKSIVRRAYLDKYDGVELKNIKDVGSVATQYAVFYPNQIKSATGNTGAFDGGNADIRYSTSIEQLHKTKDDVIGAITSMKGELLGTSNNFAKLTNWFNNQMHKARINPIFGRAWRVAGDYVEGVQDYTMEVGVIAPTLIPTYGKPLQALKDLGLAALTLGGSVRANIKQVHKVSKAVFEGTLNYERNVDGTFAEADSVKTAGVVWTDDELKSLYNLNEKEIQMYREYRDTIDFSMNRMASALIHQIVEPYGLTTGKRVDFESLSTNMIKSLKLLKEGSERDSVEIIEKSIRAIKKVVTTTHILRERGYAPLQRYGKFWVELKTKDGKVLSQQLFESKIQADAFARDAFNNSNGKYFVNRRTMSKEENDAINNIPLQAIGMYAEMMKMAMPDKAEMFNNFLKMTSSDTSALQHKIKRSGVEGYSDDLLRGLASFVGGNARMVSSIYTRKEMADALMNAKEYKDDGQNKYRGGEIEDEIKKLYKALHNYDESSQFIKGFLFMQYLGGSMAGAIVNSSSIPMTLYPRLTQYSGDIDVAKVIAKNSAVAAKSVLGKGYHIQDKVIADAYEDAKNSGVLSPNEYYQFNSLSGGNTVTAEVYNKFSTLWGSMFGAVESFNRHTAYLSALEIGKNLDIKALGIDGVKDLNDFGKYIADETNFRYGKESQSNFSRSPVGGVIMTFKTFTISYLELLSRMPRAQKIRMLGVLLLASGLSGLPFMGNAEDLIDALGQQLGYNTNSKRWRKEVLNKVFGDFSNVFENGVLNVSGADLSSRIGMSKPLPATGIFKKTEKDKLKSALEVFGVGGSYVNGVLKASFGEADLETVLPVSVGNAIRGIRMSATGEYLDGNGNLVTKVSKFDAAKKFIGFMPVSVKEARAKINYNNQTIEYFKGVKSKFTDRLATARANNDIVEEKKVWKEIDTWNRDKTNPKIVIERGNLKKSITKKTTPLDEKFKPPKWLKDVELVD